MAQASACRVETRLDPCPVAAGKRRDESRRGTQECVRHVAVRHCIVQASIIVPPLSRFPGEQVGSAYSELPCRLLLGGCPEGVEPGGDPHILESQTNPDGDELCLRQSAGDSTRPQVDVRPDVLAQVGLNHNVGELQPAARPQHAGNLSEGYLLFRHQVQDPIGNNHINASGLDR